jgi:hypothetical protein
VKAWTKRNLIFVIAQHRVPFVWPFTTLAGRLSAERDYGDLTCPVDFDARNTHTRGSHGPDDSGHVLLPECGGGARHWITVAKPAYGHSFESIEFGHVLDEGRIGEFGDDRPDALRFPFANGDCYRVLDQCGDDYHSIIQISINLP